MCPFRRFRRRRSTRILQPAGNVGSIESPWQRRLHRIASNRNHNGLDWIYPLLRDPVASEPYRTCHRRLVEHERTVAGRSLDLKRLDGPEAEAFRIRDRRANLANAGAEVGSQRCNLIGKQ